MELMSKWQMTMALMGVTMEDVFDDWDDDQYYFGRLEEYEKYLRLITNPDPLMKAVMMTTEMGVTADDVEYYHDHLVKLDDEREMQERELRINNSPLVKSLREDYAFEFITAKQYPNHTHFKFKDKTGLEITGRTFRYSWDTTRAWLSWKDAKKKRHNQRIDIGRYHNIAKLPKEAPKEWSDHSGYAYGDKMVSQILAWRIAERKLPAGSAGAGITYPKP